MNCVPSLTRLAAASLVVGALAATSAKAQTFGFDRAGRCAHMGAGFVPVAGSDGCVRIGGHVRVEMGSGREALGGSPGARDGVRQAAERVQVHPDLLNSQGAAFPR